VHIAQSVQHRVPKALVVAMTLFVPLAVCPHAFAAPHDIKVDTNEITEQGAHALEVHMNVARPAPDNRRGHVWQLMPEYSYGYARNWALALQLPLSRVGDNFYANGAGAEVQYVAPHDNERGGYWGASVKLVYASPIGERSSWALELVPIAGTRSGKFHFAVNLGLAIPIGGAESKVTFQPAAMLAYAVNARNGIGFEYYSDLGPLKNFAPRDEQERTLYAVWNRTQQSFNLNLGIGRGLTHSSDRWVLKASAGIDFN
jgi:hypothetical protein